MPSESFANGTVTSRDRAALVAGEMQGSTGGYYRKGDIRLHKIGGRSTFGATGTSLVVDGVHIAVFDDGTGRVLALSNNVIYSATISGSGLSGTFTSLKSGLTDTTNFSVQHFNDRHYMASGDGTNRIQVLEDDGTVYDAGMEAPTTAPTLTGVSSGGLIARPNAGSGTFTNEALAYDTTADTYSSAVLSSITNVTTTFTVATSNTGSSRYVSIDYALTGSQSADEYPSDGGLNDAGEQIDGGFDVNVKIEVSEDSGVTFTTVLELLSVSFPLARRILKTDYTNSTNSNLAQFKITLTYNAGVSQCALRIYDIRIQDGSTVSAFSTTVGLFYAIGEFDQTRGHYSPPSDAVFITLASKKAVDMVLPSAATNSRATHWVIYRTGDGGSKSQLGQIGLVLIAQTSFTDTFENWLHTEQPRPLVRAVIVSSAGGATGVIPFDTPPPELVHLFQHDGSLCGLSRTKPRVLRYTPAGFPESWPEVFTVIKFMMPQNDQLQTAVSLGDLIVVVAKGLAFRVIGLPRSVRSTFESEVRQIQGSPGGVGRKCLASFSVAGEARAAYISNEGLVQTNGYQHYPISSDFDWTPIQDFDKSNWVLFFDERRDTLVFCWSNTDGGNNDRYALFHMHPDHQKENGQPKWTGPHFGAIHALGSGQVGNRRRLYSSHPSDGTVYVEDSGSTDTSNAYDSDGTNPLIVRSRRLQPDDEFSIMGASLRHTDFGIGQEATVEFTTGRDSNDNTQVATKTVSLNGHKRTFFEVGLGGGWAEWTITHTGDSQGALLDLPFNARSLGPSGEVKIA